MKIKYISLTALLALTHITLAAHQTPSRWKGSNASFGLTMNTGGNNTTNFNFGSIVQYTKPKWSQNLNLSYQLAYTNHEQTQGLLNGTENVNYYFSADKKTFASGNLNVISDITSAYRYTVVGSAMYGRTLHHSKMFTWDAQIGPGIRYNAPYTGEQGYTRPVAVFLSNFTWALKSWGTLTENMRYEYGKPYNFFQTTTNLTNKLYGHLALQFSFQLNHYSSMPVVTKVSALTSTSTVVSLVYNF